MIFKFKLVSEDVSNFSREIEIDADSTFLQLRNAILDSVDYSKDDIDSFFLCDDDWSREEEITLTEMDSSSDRDIWLMENTPLNEMIEEDGQKLVFVFDYLTDRCFYMEMKESVPGKHLSEPICTLKKGKAPAQFIDIDEFETKIDLSAAKTDVDLDMDDIYDANQYDEEDLASGFDIDNSL